MKKFSIFTAVFTLMIMSFCATPLFAKDTGAYIGIGGSYAVEDFKMNEDASTFLGAIVVSEGFDNANGLNLKVGYHINNIFSLEFNYDHLSDFEWDYTEIYAGIQNSVPTDMPMTAEAKVGIKTFMIVGKVAPDFGLKVVRPFVTAGLGVMRSTLDISDSDTAGDVEYFSDSETGICFKVGTGIDLFVHENVSVGFELAYVVGDVSLEILDQEIISECRYVNYTLGVAYHF